MLEKHSCFNDLNQFLVYCRHERRDQRHLAHGEEAERVDVVAEVEAALLARAQREGGHEGASVGVHVAEGRVARRRVHQQLPVQGEAVHIMSRNYVQGGQLVGGLTAGLG